MLYRVERLRHYGLIQQFIDHKNYKNAAYYHLQEAEWRAWDTLEKTVSAIAGDLVNVTYVSGWSAGIRRLSNDRRIANAHMSLYERDLTLYTLFDSSDNSYTPVGSNQMSAKQFLMSCCQEALDNVLSDNVDMYIETKDKIIKAISILPTLIDNWINARNAWTGKICCDATKELYIFSTSQMLIDIATVISTGSS